MPVRTLKGFLILCLVVGGGAPASAAPASVEAVQPTISSVTLYTEGPGQVEGGLDVSSGRAVEFTLTRHLIPESLEVVSGEETLPSSLSPVYEQREFERVLKHYTARLESVPQGVRTVRLRYLTQGLGWSPAFSLDLRDGTSVFSYDLVIENAGEAIAQAKVTLVSGRVEGLTGSRYREYGYDYSSRELYRMVLSRLGRHIPAPSGPGNIHTARELASQKIPAGTTKLPVLKARLPVARTYIWDANWIEYVDPAVSKRAHAVLTLSNETGLPLAEGTVRVSEKGVYVGEALLGWTEPGEQSIIVMSGAKDLTVDKTEATENRLETYELVHTVSFKVANARQGEVEVQIVEEPARRRYDEERVYEFSQQPETTDDGAFRWTLTIPPGSERVVSYHYSKPLDLSQFVVVKFRCDDSLRERKYLHQDAGSRHWARYKMRSFDRHAYGIYRLDLPDDLERADLELQLANNFVVSLAPEAAGAPGEFEVAARALTLFRKDVRNYSNDGSYYLDLAPHLAKSPGNVVLVKLEDGTRANAEGATLKGIVVYRVPEGWPSRARDYTKALAAQPMFGTLENAGFEEVVGGFAASWQPRDSGYTVESTAAHSGRYSLRFSNPGGDPSFKAYTLQTVVLEQDAPRPVRVSGWSKAQDVTGEKNKEYSLWIDGEFVSGGPWWGVAHLAHSVGTHDWEYVETVVVPPEPLSKLFVHAVFRAHGGTAWFDDMWVHEYRDWKPADPVPRREHFLQGELPCDKPLAKQATPYYLIANATVPEGKTLTIERGVEIVFDSDYSITVGGDIRAQGTEDQPVRFVAAQVPTPGGFRPAKAAIRYALLGTGEQAGKNSAFEHCVFQDVAAPTK